MVPFIETGLQPPVPVIPYLETGGSNGSLFRNWIATPLSNCSIFRNRLQPYKETFRKATPFQRFHMKELVGLMVPYLETGLQPPFQLFHI